VWSVEPQLILNQLTGWLDELAHSGDITEYHDINITNLPMILRITLSQGLI
jgi:hypothetical protein